MKQHEKPETTPAEVPRQQVHPGVAIQVDFVDWDRTTPELLAEKSGIPLADINLILEGRMDIDGDMSRRISRALDLQGMDDFWFKKQQGYDRR